MSWFAGVLDVIFFFAMNSENQPAYIKRRGAQMHLAKRKYFADKKFLQLNTSLHAPYKDGQLKLF
jgi:hypothetical protein